MRSKIWENQKSKRIDLEDEKTIWLLFFFIVMFIDETYWKNLVATQKVFLKLFSRPQQLFLQILLVSAMQLPGKRDVEHDIV